MDDSVTGNNLDQSQSILSTPDTGAKEVSISEKTLNVGSFIEESENRQLAECRDIIENTPVLRGGLAGKTKRGLRENTEKLQDLSENVINLSEDLSNLDASVEHCNAFAKTCDKPEASNESSKNTAHNLYLTPKREETEKQSEVRQIQSLQTNGSSVEESQTSFYHLINTTLFALFVWFLIVYAFSELKLAQKNFDGLADYTASTEREIEYLRNNLDAVIKQLRKTESELKLTQGNLDELRRDKAENDLKRKEAKVPFVRSDVVIVKSEMSLEMQNHAIELMLESMKECTCAADVTKFITGKMREKYGSEWICFISNGKPNPIVLDNQYFLSVYLKMDVVYIELIA
ncbi:dynein light chain type 1 domain-containing protein [Ditylenchus destructor]|uniref:Dynein light chain type 1 domain-containing protein n=1 Tax=Ditylenchus destructor TaxID=166010 RepID=A0AAD4MN51_9BILA|nr:dynein light chain type 1 domain-containing protein [Ditylenchus destructor]